MDIRHLDLIPTTHFMDNVIKQLQTANQDIKVMQDSDGFYYVALNSKNPDRAWRTSHVLANTSTMKVWKKLDAAISYITKNFDLI